MIWITALLAGFLFALATWLILHRDWLRIIFGVMVLGHGANLVILSSSGDPRGKLPPITGGEANLADPLPQALLLTAIVIGFAVVAFFITLVYRILSDNGDLDLGELFDR
ncbi:Na(+)/H(+) antiporter subunit C [Puniceicoccales bacterium CK1056]|uniref:Na(+)/H(+) antiporter subunit C n=1 Tax=Oceanipulchritudo coccoides TaxID=2706888 RepID=A0A6B2M5V4_9BACT|nr:sodium:proton antiporter [Oceanipulchritudo coccoides]NDV63539.1 Na(+)/H(+) antiporter subunit C [Oceanipulchritudo coccoides]